jgi:hypothetical protein
MSDQSKSSICDLLIGTNIQLLKTIVNLIEMEKDILSMYTNYTPSRLLEREMVRAIPYGIHLIHSSFNTGKMKVSIVYIIMLLASTIHKYKIICTTRANKALNDWSHNTKLEVEKNSMDKVIIHIHSLLREKLKIWEHCGTTNPC